MYMPRFLVTQEVYDAASLSERQKYNYVVDEQLHSLPKFFNIPKQEDATNLDFANRVPIID